jgi:VanZ family protein
LKRGILVALGWTWAGAIVWLSLTPSPPKVDFAESDKLGHFIAYGGLMFWFSMLYLKRASRAAYAAGFIAMGVGLEFVQGWLGYRTYEVFDMVANTMGVLLGLALALAMPRIRAR